MQPLKLLSSALFICVSTAAAVAINATQTQELVSRQASSKLVFAHFMIGIVADRTSSADYDADMQLAKSAGIDAFALNIGTDPYTDQQLGYAYESAARNGMKVFISFDFNWWSPGNAGGVAQKTAQYGTLPAQLLINGKIFISSFIGGGLDFVSVRNQVRQQIGKELHIVFNSWTSQPFDNVDGAFNWMGWPSDGNNKAPKAGRKVNVVDGDRDYLNKLGSKNYMAAVSPWFFTHFGPEVSYSKNWVFPGELLWYRRWVDLLNLKPTFAEIVTWNDYGESHYVAPLSSKHNDDGASKWINDMPHSGWLDMAKPFIAAYKAGATSVNNYITQEKIVYWYRPTLRGLNCDSTDTTMVPANNASGNYFMGRPDGWETNEDKVFVVALLKSAGQVVVNSGGTVATFNAPAGASAFTVDMHVGAQTFTLNRNGAQVFSATSLRSISNTCPCGLYNFNAYVGTVPAGGADPLGSDGLRMFQQGLKVACEPRPSLPASPPSPAQQTATAAATPAPTGSI